jgi:hypothetical protein
MHAEGWDCTCVIESMPSEPEQRREGEQLLALRVNIATKHPRVTGMRICIGGSGLTLHLRDRLRECPVHQYTHTWTSAHYTDLSRCDPPSKTPRRIPHPTADPNADRGPAARELDSPNKIA